MNFENNLKCALFIFLIFSCHEKTASVQSKKEQNLPSVELTSADSTKSETDQNKAPQRIQDPLLKSESTIIAPHTKYSFPFTLNAPDRILTLSRKLKEISGLSYDLKQDRLLAINDEQANIYQINPSNGEIIEITDFGKNGDYEGIEKVGNDIYILKSNGNLYLKDSSKEKKSQIIRTDLRAANDVEGLGYDKISHSLLLACKGKPTISSKQNLKKTKVVYAYNVTEGVCSKQPFLEISDDDLSEYIQNKYGAIDDSDFPVKKMLKLAKSFAPSAITQHPDLESFYILSSIGKLLVVVDRNSNILSVEFLDSAIHAQPEGISFDNHGDLYISNEGKYGIAKIYFYSSK